MDDTTPSPRIAPAAASESPGFWSRYGRYTLLAAVLAVLLWVFASGGSQGLGHQISEHWGTFEVWVDENFWLALCLYFLAYVLVTGLSIPIANVLSIGAGIVFGLWAGLALVSFGSTAGATLAMLASRYFFRDLVRHKLGARFDAINENIAREGAFYLFTLRLMVVVPFWMINLAVGLTALPVRTFWWVSQVGMLPGTFLYINAGAEARKITGVGDIFSPTLILSFGLLGIAPLLLRWLVLWLRGGR